MAQDFHDSVVTHIPVLRAYARTLKRKPEEADDLVQECLARAIEKKHLWQPGGNLKAWLFTILHNQFVNDMRKRTRRPETAAASVADSMLATAAPQTERIQLRELEQALHQLTDAHREALALVVIHGMQYQEAAEILDVPMGTVRSRLSRARQELKQCLGRSEETELESVSAGYSNLQVSR